MIVKTGLERLDNFSIYIFLCIGTFLHNFKRGHRKKWDYTPSNILLLDLIGLCLIEYKCNHKLKHPIVSNITHDEMDS